MRLQGREAKRHCLEADASKRHCLEAALPFWGEMPALKP
jgi:hypothetical protein